MPRSWRVKAQQFDTATGTPAELYQPCRSPISVSAEEPGKILHSPQDIVTHSILSSNHNATEQQIKLITPLKFTVTFHTGMH